MKALIFDLFETLISEWSHEKYTKRKIAADLNVNIERFAEVWDATEDERTLGAYPNMDVVLNTILAEMGTAVDMSAVNAAAQKWETSKAELFQTINPDIARMLSEARDCGYKLGLITNCWFDEMLGFQDSELHSYFDASVLSCEVGVKKPDEAIYATCLEYLRVQPWECVYIGDGGSHELTAARDLGMKAYRATWFIKDHMENYAKVTGFKCLSEITDVIPLLKRIESEE